MKKKVTNTAGAIKDYLKGIIWIAAGALLVILGIVWISILPLAIVLFVLGAPTVVNGLRLIIHNKKNNTIVYDDSQSTSSSSSSSSSEGTDWEEEFKHAITKKAYGAYKTVDVHTSFYDWCIQVNVSIDYFGSNDASIIASEVKSAADLVRDAYQSVAKKCPYSSKLSIEQK